LRRTARADRLNAQTSQLRAPERKRGTSSRVPPSGYKRDGDAADGASAARSTNA